MPRTPLKSLVDREINYLRETLQGMNLLQLEAASKISRSTLWRIRQGRHRPEAETIDAIWAGIEALEQAENE